MSFDRNYTNIYVVSAILAACFIFMIASTGVVMGGISNKTSADLAVEKMQKECEQMGGTLVTKNAHLSLQSYCDTNHVTQ